MKAEMEKDGEAGRNISSVFFDECYDYSSTTHITRSYGCTEELSQNSLVLTVRMPV
jgi:hypothetical protein